MSLSFSPSLNGKTSLFARTALGLAVGAATLMTGAQADAALVYGVTQTNTLFSFDSATPNALNFGAAISGLQLNERVVGIDFRPADNGLYAVGSTGRIYTLNTTNGTASLKSVLAADPADLTSPFTSLDGTEFGIDFNPTVDRLRLVSNSRQNLRINVDTGLVTTDAALNPGTPNIMAAAYTNSFVGAPSTTLYTIDSLSDVLNTQNPPNNGTQVLVGSLGGVDFSALGGLDIDPNGNQGYAALMPVSSNVSGFYTVNLVTGAAVLVGQIDGGIQVADIAVVIPEPGTVAMLGLAAAAMIRRRNK